mgnify:CR=1 FL=1
MFDHSLLFMNLGTTEIIMLLVVILLLFGGKKIPELARGLGKGIREFKDASSGVQKEIEDSMKNPPVNNTNTTNPTTEEKK